MTESKKTEVAILLHNLLLKSEKEFYNFENKIREADEDLK